MSKKLFVLFTALTLGLTSIASIAPAVSAAKTSSDFSDLKDLDAATKAKFDAMISAGIFDGVSESSFGLNDKMNRAQFAKVAALIFGLEVDKNLKTSSFSDVKSDDPANGYALPYIEAVKRAGITDGVAPGAFDPAGTVTKEQLAAFLVRGLGQEQEAKAAPGVTDPTVSDWAKGYVQLALEQKLLENSLTGAFGGKVEARRELLATGSFESARTFEAAQPLEVAGADFTAGNKLDLTLTVAIDADSIDLSKITINGVPLDPKLDSYELSEDKKTIVIKLREGFKLDTSKTPVIVALGLKTLFGNEVKNEESKPIPVKLTDPPAAPPTVTYTPSPSTSTPSTPPSVPDVTLTIDTVNAEIGYTSASFPVTGSVTGAVYYSVLPSSFETPSLEAIRLGTNATDYDWITLDGTRGHLNLEGLSTGTSYVLYAYELAANNKTSGISRVPFLTLTEEQNIPVITFNANGTSREIGANSDLISASVDPDGADTLYYVLIEGDSVDSPPPSVEQVKLGLDAVGQPAQWKGTMEQSSSEPLISITEGLLSDKFYALYVVGSKGQLDSRIVGYTFYPVISGE